VRPISRARTTRATSNSPRDLRSFSNSPTGWSSWARSRSLRSIQPRMPHVL
jgi:hypothetical protein